MNSAFLRRIGQELRILGALNLLAPLIVAAIYLGFSLIVGYATLHNSGSPADARFQAARGLLALLENGLPLIGGLLAAFVVGSDPAIELHLAAATPYRFTAGLRLALIILWTTLCTGGAALVITAAGYWLAILQSLSIGESILLWLAPLLWFIGAGATLALLLRSRAASGALLGMVWIAQFIFKPQFLQNGVLERVYLFLTEEAGVPSYWLANRLILLAIALALLGLTMLLLGRSESLLGGEH